MAALINTRDVANLMETYLKYFTDDAVLLPARGPAIDGKANALAFYNRAFEGLRSLQVQYGEPTILIDGSLAVMRYTGVARVELAGQDAPSTSANKYVDVLQKQNDGSWKIVWHAWNDADLRSAIGQAASRQAFGRLEGGFCVNKGWRRGAGA
jgi:ketosteroid isomerase-like protein